jgi:glutamate---cysteine ligase / carboxylate-amine ligase
MVDETSAMTLGVEEEFFVVDTDSGALSASSEDLLEATRPALGESVTPELNQCQIEIATKVCSTLDDVRDDLGRLRRGIVDAGAPHGLAIAAVGTHPFSAWDDQEVNRVHDRYAQMEERFQIIARQQVICGCHVHVGFEDPNLAVATMNRARAWMPALLALSANSPFWSGRDTGFMSYRTEVWQRWPTAGFGPVLESHEHFESLTEELTAIGAIEDSSFLYWYMRPSSHYPTLEFRICDVPLHAEDTVAIAGLIRALAWTCRRDALRDQPAPWRGSEAMEAAMWRAARYGVRGDLVHALEARTAPAAEVIDHLLEYTAEGLEVHGDRALVEKTVASILDRGPGAELQRSALARRDSMQDVMDEVLERTVA